ncbi:MAG: hypothetical protein ABL986_08500 [Vicinamibacterales bacterium]
MTNAIDTVTHTAGAPMPRLSAKDFERVLSNMPRTGGRQLDFLKAHAEAKGRALNMRSIAKAAGYKNYRGGNLQYGRLAERIAQKLGQRQDAFSLLVEFVPPKGKSADHISNEEWILIMREPFSTALKRVGWI